MLSIFITINILTSCAHSNRRGQKLTAGGPNDSNVSKWSVIFELAYSIEKLHLNGDSDVGDIVKMVTL